MNRIIFTILSLSLMVTLSTQAQSIRKNYKEMTQSQRDALVSAFYQLRMGRGLINDKLHFIVIILALFI